MIETLTIDRLITEVRSLANEYPQAWYAGPLSTDAIKIADDLVPLGSA